MLLAVTTLGVLGGTAAAIGWAYSTMNNAQSLIAAGEKYNVDLSDDVSRSLGLDFHLQGITLEKMSRNGLVSFYGYYCKSNEYGQMVDVGTAVDYRVNSYLADSIMEKVNKLQNVSPELFRISRSKKNEILGTYEDLFTLFHSVLNEEYLGKRDVGTTLDIQKAVDGSYGYMNANSMSNVTAYTGTDYRNVGHNIVNISNVYYDEERRTNFFYVESVSTKTGSESGEIEFHKAMVEVRGNELPDEDVYAAFLAGKHDKFTEIKVNENMKKQIASHFVEVEFNYAERV